MNMNTYLAFGGFMDSRLRMDLDYLEMKARNKPIARFCRDTFLRAKILFGSETAKDELADFLFERAQTLGEKGKYKCAYRLAHRSLELMSIPRTNTEELNLSERTKFIIKCKKEISKKTSKKRV